MERGSNLTKLFIINFASNFIENLRTCVTPVILEGMEEIGKGGGNGRSLGFVSIKKMRSLIALIMISLSIRNYNTIILLFLRLNREIISY